MSDYKGAALIRPVLPKTKTLLGDKGYDADWLRQALADRHITACIPSKANRKIQIPHDAALYRRRHKVSPTPQDRDHVRSPQRLASYPHPPLIVAIQPMPIAETFRPSPDRRYIMCRVVAFGDGAMP